MTTLGATPSTTTFPAVAADVGADVAGAAAAAQSAAIAAAASDATTKANAAQAAAIAASQPADSDLTAIAALTTTSYGRALLELANAAAGRTALGLGTAAVAASGDFQPNDSDLTAIAALTTTSYGRSLLEAANAGALRTLAGLVIGTDVQAFDADIPTVAASQGDMEAGTEAALRSMSPLRVAQAIDALAAGGGSDDQTAAEVPFTPAGTIAATNTQTAVEEVATDAASALSTHDADTTAVHGIANTANLYAAGGTDVAVADGGTGAGTAAGARTNLGLGTAATIPIPFLPLRSGGTFQYLPAHGASSSTAVAQSTLFAVPFFVPVATTFTKMIGLVVTGAASSNLRLGIYSDTGGVPDALVLDAGTVASTANADAPITFGSPLALAAGWYWLACVSQGGAPTMYCATGNNVDPMGNVPTAGSIRSAGAQKGYSQTGITGALPSPWGATLTQVFTAPLVALVPQ